MPTTAPIACSLEEAERPRRGALLERLGRELSAIEAEGLEARLRFPATERPALESFVEAESGCCPFFDFSIAEDEDRIELRIVAPAGGEWAVRGLVAGFAAGWGGLL